MKKHCFMALLATFLATSPALAQTDGMKLRSVETWGDALGHTSIDKMSAKVVTYYNSQNLPISETRYGANYDDRSQWVPIDYTVMLYNDQQQVVKKYTQEYGLLDNEIMGYKEAKDTVYYYYYPDGKLKSEFDTFSGDSLVYEYDDSGNMTKKSNYINFGNPTLSWSETYSDFVLPGCPATITGDGTYDEQKFTATVKYDEQGNMLEKSTVNTKGDPTAHEKWTYTYGVLSLHESSVYKKAEGDENYTEVPKNKTEYTVESDNPMRIREILREYSDYDQQWYSTTYQTVKEYFTPQPDKAPAMEATVSETEKNTVILTIYPKDIPNMEQPGIDILRHGIKVAQISLEGQNIQDGVTFEDKKIKNGNYDYMAVPVDLAVTDGETDPMCFYGSGLNASDIKRITLQTELPAATNIRPVSYRSEYGERYATIVWDEPTAEQKEELGFIGYNVYNTAMRVPENRDGELTTNTFEVNYGYGNDGQNIQGDFYVETVYEYGTSKSKVATISNLYEYGLKDAKVRSVETWGDKLGEMGPDELASKVVSYYDNENKLVREGTYGKALGTSGATAKFSITKYKTYEYNDKSQLVKTYSSQYGLYDGLDLAFKESKDTVYYEYNDNGKLICEYDPQNGDSIVYEYDEAGNKVKYLRYKPDYYGTINGGKPYVMESLAYSDFVALDCPTKIVGDGRYDSYKTTATLTYNENFDITSKIVKNSIDEPKEAEYWTYENNMPATYEKRSFKKNSEGIFEEVPSLRYVYTQISYDPMRIRRATWSYEKSEDKWYEQPVSEVTEYFSPEESTSPELTVSEIPDKLNSYALSFTTPEISGATNVAYDVLRDGIKIARISAENAIGGNIVYNDEYVKNGRHDYMVQTVDKDADASGVDALYSYGFGMNTSEIATVNPYTELPVATNLRVVDLQENDGIITATIKWDEPENKEKYNFSYYNVFNSGFKIPENVEADQAAGVNVVIPITENTYSVSLGEKDASGIATGDFYVQAVYAIGKVNGETTTLDNRNADGIGERKIRSVETWGDALGEMSPEELASKVVNYYDKNNNIIREGTYGKKLGTNGENSVFDITRYRVNEYNDGGQLVKTYSNQYGLYDGLELGFKESTDTVYYEYNNDGKLICKYDPANGDSIVYEYDEEGNKVKYLRYKPDYYGTINGGKPYVMESQTYSDFVAPDCPTKITGDGRYDSYKTTTVLEYDDKFNLISKTVSKSDGKLKEEEKWVYELNMLAYYEKNKFKTVTADGTETTEKIPYLKKYYKKESTEPLRVRETTEVYDDILKVWSVQPVSTVTEYFMPDKNSATMLEISPIDGEFNSYDITFNTVSPEGTDASDLAYDIYRDGIKIKRYTADEVAGTDKVTFSDKLVANGRHDYMIQAVDIKADTTGIDPMSSYGHGMNAAVSERMDINTELPSATNLRVLKLEETDGDVYATITWDEPADKEAYSFTHYNVFNTKFKVPENVKEDGSTYVTDPILDNEYKILIGEATADKSRSCDIYVQTVYLLGKVNSDTITVSESTTGIEDVLSGSGEVVYDNGKLIVDDNASISIFAANGTTIVNNHRGSYDMSKTPSGVYLIRVNNRGVTSTTKIVKP